MGIYTYSIGAISLGTSTAKTQLDGAQQGSASSWTLPASCRGILDITAFLTAVTPTATETTVASLKVECGDIGLNDFEFLANPLNSNIATTDLGLTDLMRGARMPAFWRTNGGENMNFYGIAQTANTAAPYMGATVTWTDDPSVVNQDRPYYAKIGGTAGAAGSGTSTGTSAALVTGKSITLSGAAKVIRGATGIVAATTMASVKPIAGYFKWTANEMKQNISYTAESLPGNLNAAQATTHLTRVDGLNIPVNSPSTLQGYLQLQLAPSTAGNFYQGIYYQ